MTMIESASVMLLPVLLLSEIRRHFDGQPVLRDVCLGFVFAVIGTIVISNSVELLPGIRTDPRAAVIVLAFLFGGPIGGLLTVSTLIAMRVSQGGAGVVPGLSFMVGVSVAALAYTLWRRRGDRGPPSLRTVVMGAGIAGLVPPAILVFLTALPLPIFLTSTALSTPTNVLAVILVGALLIRDRERETAIRRQLDKQAQINAIAENAPAVIFQARADTEGAPRLTYVSAAAGRILGLAPSGLLQAQPPFAVLLCAEDAARLAGQFDPTAQTGESWSLELSYRHPTGPRWMRIAAGLRRNELGCPIWDGTVTDITEQRLAEETKDNFISVISHELRTPLTSIRGALGLLLASPADALPPAKARMLRIASQNAERLVRLVNEILDTQKIRAGGMTYDIAAQPLRPIILSAIAAIRDYAPEKNLDIPFENDAGEAQAEIDAHRLSLVLQNLLSNAIKFAPPDSDIVVRSEVLGESLHVSVSDRGPGIPEEFQDYVFDRFRQAQAAHDRGAGGTGLGLSIAKSFVTAMGGRIWFQTDPATGTTFTIAFPLAAGERALATPGAEEVATSGGDAPPGSRDLPLLLYVEDDDSLQQVVRERAEGRARVVSATTLAQARTIHARSPADIILLDLDLPDGTGAGLIDELADSVPVVVFTAYELDPAVARRVAGVLVKSRVPEEEVIEEVLNLLAEIGPAPDRSAA